MFFSSYDDRGIQARHGLVQNPEGGVVQQGTDQHQFLPHAMRVTLDAVTQHVFQFEPPGKVPNPFLPVGRRHIVHVAH